MIKIIVTKDNTGTLCGGDRVEGVQNGSGETQHSIHLYFNIFLLKEFK